MSGILCQLPVPDHLDGVELTSLIEPGKDVDGLTPVSAGLLALGRAGLRPCTPTGVMLLLEEAGAQLEGAEAVVVGRSNLFGKPMAQLLLGANATVTICHSRTRDLAEVCRRADILVAAVGRDRMVKGDWVKPGATVIDVGINRSDDGLHGDVDFDEAVEVAGAITPVPGGVGPMTIACLLRNTLQAARMAVRVSRLRAGEWTAAVGAAALLVTLFLPWFDVAPGPAGDLVNPLLADEGGTSGWNALAGSSSRSRSRPSAVRRGWRSPTPRTATRGPAGGRVGADGDRRDPRVRRARAARRSSSSPAPTSWSACATGRGSACSPRWCSPSAAGWRSRTSAPTRPRAPTPRPSPVRLRPRLDSTGTHDRP